MNKPLLAACSIAALGAIAVGFHIYNLKNEINGEQLSSTNTKEIAIQPDNADQLAKAPSENKRLSDAMPPPSEMEVLMVKSGKISGENLWLTNRKNPQRPPSQYSHFTDDGVNRAYIKIQRLEIEALEVGSNFTVDIPQTGGAFEAEVSDTHYHSNGDKSVTAVIADSDGEPYTVTITQGEGATFGTFSTPDGVYILEAGTNDGWLASKSDLIHIQDRSKTDEVYVKPDNSDLPPS